MGIISTILGSSVFMGIIAFVCAVFCIRCLIYGVMGGTSTLLRILATLLFACLAYYCWHRAIATTGPNAIDNFVFDSWIEFKKFIVFLKNKIL